MAYQYTTSFEGGSAKEPDYVYYNCDIINNRTSDLNQSGLALPDPPIRFNETRDAPLVKDASKYHFSIIRFTMNGANRDLPMFIPNIQTGQPDPDLTTYKVAIAYQQTWNMADGTTQTYTILPKPSVIRYESEYTNPLVAPIPVSPLSQQDLTSRYYWVTTYNQALTWFNAGLVGCHNAGTNSALTPADPDEGTYQQFQNEWATRNGSLAQFPYPTFTDFQNDVNTPQITFSSSTKRFSIWGDSDGFGQRIVGFTPVTNQADYDNALPYQAGSYVYYLGTYYQALVNVPALGPLPNTGAPNWSASVATPPNFTVPATPQTSPQFRLFFNTNMYGLFANFPVEYYNRTDITGFNIPSPTPAIPPAPAGYTFEMLFINKFYQNLVDYRLAPYSGAAPLGLVPVANQSVYYQMEQDYQSIDSLWSPISSIVFTTSLIPVKTESTGQPLVLGESNIGTSTATTQNAFQPIITDIALDQQLDGADDYRQFIYYAPSAEYRLSDFTASKQDIRNIDIQVFYKNRLDNNLYPINMFNLSSVSIKMMFRHKRVAGYRTD